MPATASCAPTRAECAGAWTWVPAWSAGPGSCCWTNPPPASTLGAEWGCAIRSLVADGTDVLLNTQYLEDADQLARDVVIVDRGRVLDAGTPDELKDRAGRDVIEARPRAADDLVAVE